METKKIKDGQYPDQDTNSGPPKYEARVQLMLYITYIMGNTPLG